MELVSGETLQQRVAPEGRLPVEDALGVCRQIAELSAQKMCFDLPICPNQAAFSIVT
jgi:hypothetical protein